MAYPTKGIQPCFESDVASGGKLGLLIEGGSERQLTTTRLVVPVPHVEVKWLSRWSEFFARMRVSEEVGTVRVWSFSKCVSGTS